MTEETTLTEEAVSLPTLETGRLLLRPWTLADAPVMQKLAGEKCVARFTSLPHPYKDGEAEKFIGTHEKQFAEGKALVLAITLRESGEIIGCIGLHGDFSTGISELGYWIGAEFWGKGYCTEAARAMVDYGFRALKLCRVHARHFAQNAASGKVMQKVGMAPEGLRRQHLFRWGEYDDEVLYGMLKAEFEALAKQ
jgi:[ribosomal protein S5]-alanine N-acetyltransferase